jgi:hypothetical protein
MQIWAKTSLFSRVSKCGTVQINHLGSVFLFFSDSVFSCPHAARMSRPRGHRIVTGTPTINKRSQKKEGKRRVKIPASCMIFANFWIVSDSEASKKVPGHGLNGLISVRERKST